MSDQDLDRNEPATPHKLQKARERGQAARSAEVVTAAVFATAVAYLYWHGWNALQWLWRLDHSLLVKAGRMDGSEASLVALLGKALTDALVGLVPFFTVLAAVAVLASLLQTGPILSIDPVKADFNRLNPANGFRRVFSLRSLFEAARALAKLLVLGFVAWQLIAQMAPRFAQLAAWPPAVLARAMVTDVAAAGLKVALALLLIAAVDLIYTRREFMGRMRMSHRELKEEYKQREGDPRIRARLRELRREALKRIQAVGDTARADVVVTNPTHVAVALRYDPSELAAPQVVAKGVGAMAAMMRQIAARNRIPVVQSPPLARELFRSLRVEQHVPPQMYAEVARILVWVFAMRQQRRAGAAS